MRKIKMRNTRKMRRRKMRSRRKRRTMTTITDATKMTKGTRTIAPTKIKILKEWTRKDTRLILRSLAIRRWRCF